MEAAVRASETTHSGELRFVVEGDSTWPTSCAGELPPAGGELFHKLRVDRTKAQSGVLIYVQLADRRVEILADRGIDSQVQEDTWRTICRLMEEAFAVGNFERGAVAGVEAVGRLLAAHFPAGKDDIDELPNAPEVL